MEEKENVVSTEEPSQPATKTNFSEDAATINNLREKLSQLQEENDGLREAKKKYYDVLLNETNQPEVEIVEKKRSEEEIKKDLAEAAHKGNFGAEWKYALELDDLIREKTGESAFLPSGHDLNPTVDEYAKADRIRDAYIEIFKDLEEHGEDYNNTQAFLAARSRHMRN